MTLEEAFIGPSLKSWVRKKIVSSSDHLELFTSVSSWPSIKVRKKERNWPYKIIFMVMRCPLRLVHPLFVSCKVIQWIAILHDYYGYHNGARGTKCGYKIHCCCIFPRDTLLPLYYTSRKTSLENALENQVQDQLIRAKIWGLKLGARSSKYERWCRFFATVGKRHRSDSEFF